MNEIHNFASSKGLTQNLKVLYLDFGLLVSLTRVLYP